MTYPDVTDEIDHVAVMTRIKDTMELDSTLFNSNNLKGSLVHSITLGYPNNYNWSSIPFPYAIITTDTNFEDDQPFGAAVNGTSPYAHISSSKHTCRYRIIAMADGSSSAVTEANILAIHKEIKNALKSNLKLCKPDGTNDLNVLQSRTVNSQLVDGGQFKGKTVNGVIIQFQVLIQT